MNAVEGLNIDNRMPTFLALSGAVGEALRAIADGSEQLVALRATETPLRRSKESFDRAWAEHATARAARDEEHRTFTMLAKSVVGLLLSQGMTESVTILSSDFNDVEAITRYLCEYLVELPHAGRGLKALLEERHAWLTARVSAEKRAQANLEAASTRYSALYHQSSAVLSQARGLLSSLGINASARFGVTRRKKRALAEPVSAGEPLAAPAFAANDDAPVACVG
jgi:hypothetical protein